ncbi:MAG: galactokinase [Clostridia bacterium]|nr:galactokinase [Clostridia bacterium]
MNNEELRSAFCALYGPGPVRLFKSAARINLIGEHIDFSGGLVFPAAVALRSACALRERSDGLIHLASTSCTHRVECRVDDLDGHSDLPWGGYQLGMLCLMQREGYTITGMDMLFDETVPHGGGLSASAAIELATGIAAATLSNEKSGTPIDRVALAKLGQRAENEYMGMNCGIMDQFASAMGKKGQAMLLDTAAVTCEYAPVDLEKDGLCLCIMNTNKPHNLVNSPYNARRADCEAALADIRAIRPLEHLCDLSPAEFETVKHAIKTENGLKRATHAIYENQRTKDAYQALCAGDMQGFGKILVEGHASMRDLYEATGPELDAIVDAALAQEGVLGARMMGGGYGGCAIALLREEKLEAFKEAVAKAYTAKTGFVPIFYPAHIDDGAMEIVE